MYIDGLHKFITCKMFINKQNLWLHNYLQLLFQHISYEDWQASVNGVIQYSTLSKCSTCVFTTCLECWCVPFIIGTNLKSIFFSYFLKLIPKYLRMVKPFIVKHQAPFFTMFSIKWSWQFCYVSSICCFFLATTCISIQIEIKLNFIDTVF